MKQEITHGEETREGKNTHVTLITQLSFCQIIIFERQVRSHQRLKVK